MSHFTLALGYLHTYDGNTYEAKKAAKQSGDFIRNDVWADAENEYERGVMN